MNVSNSADRVRGCRPTGTPRPRQGGDVSRWLVAIPASVPTRASISDCRCATGRRPPRRGPVPAAGERRRQPPATRRGARRLRSTSLEADGRSAARRSMTLSRSARLDSRKSSSSERQFVAAYSASASSAASRRAPGRRRVGPAGVVPGGAPRPRCGAVGRASGGRRPSHYAIASSLRSDFRGRPQRAARGSPGPDVSDQQAYLHVPVGNGPRVGRDLGEAGPTPGVRRSFPGGDDAPEELPSALASPSDRARRTRPPAGR